MTSNLSRGGFANPHLFIISGGPGSGKTTVLNELSRLGYPVIGEVARTLIQEQLRVGGNALPWADRKEYTRLMLERSIQVYLANTPSPRRMFCDRGIPDTLCYARLIDLADQSAIQDACHRYRYAPVVFLAPPWKDIYTTDDERKQDFFEAERTFTEMAEVYSSLGYELIELPRVDPGARAQFIKERLGHE
ncbi:MAG TPA: AAA family ATPase [Bryobacteraceae bacterium]|jgi:predicted ATPase|nr:AAA family ATPase [Bryobacteraceae bacterium]